MFSTTCHKGRPHKCNPNCMYLYVDYRVVELFPISILRNPSFLPSGCGLVMPGAQDRHMILSFLYDCCLVIPCCLNLSWKWWHNDIVMMQKMGSSLNSEKSVMSNIIFHFVISESCEGGVWYMSPDILILNYKLFAIFAMQSIANNFLPIPREKFFVHIIRSRTWKVN